MNPVPGHNVLPAEIVDFYIRVSLDLLLHYSNIHPYFGTLSNVEIMRSNIVRTLKNTMAKKMSKIWKSRRPRKPMKSRKTLSVPK